MKESDIHEPSGVSGSNCFGVQQEPALLQTLRKTCKQLIFYQTQTSRGICRGLAQDCCELEERTGRTRVSTDPNHTTVLEFLAYLIHSNLTGAAHLFIIIYKV